MRKIEQWMLDMVRLNETRGTLSNTAVIGSQDSKGYRSHMVYLHDNHIATVHHHRDNPTRWVQVNKDTLRDYPTRTTMSRLRALGVDVCTRKGQVMLDGLPI